MTFGRLAVSDFELGVDVIDFDECYCYLFTVYLDFAFWSILDSVCCCFEKCRCRFSKVKVRCIFSCIGSGIFWTGIFEMPEVYIMVEHVVDRSLV